jgi:hypothetical protein
MYQPRSLQDEGTHQDGEATKPRDRTEMECLMRMVARVYGDYYGLPSGRAVVETTGMVVNSWGQWGMVGNRGESCGILVTDGTDGNQWRIHLRKDRQRVA